MSAKHLAVRVHCGSAYVKGTARKYPYFIASAFRLVENQVVGRRWIHDSVVAGPYRSMAKAQREGLAWAKKHAAAFVEGYGSLHNRPE